MRSLPLVIVAQYRMDGTTVGAARHALRSRRREDAPFGGAPVRSSPFRSAARIVGLLVSFAAATASVASAQAWSIHDLTTGSRAVVIGRVISVDAAWERDVDFIYSYVTVDVEDVIAGPPLGSRIVLKQLGGAVDDVALEIADQVAFATGEHVLLFLDARPRDRTLMTTGFWQGKWLLHADASTGERLATRSQPTIGRSAWEQRTEVRQLSTIVAEVAANSSGVEGGSALVATPPEAPPPSGRSDRFTFLGTPSRWMQANGSDLPGAIPVDISGFQAGLGGGGQGEILNAAALWNNVATSSLRFVNPIGTTAGQCSAVTGAGRTMITHGDPCNEVTSANSLMASGFFRTNGMPLPVVGGSFERILRSFVILNTGVSAALQPFLTRSRCYQDLVTKGLGHSFGLGSSPDPGAIMFSDTHNGECLAFPATAKITGSLGADDIAGISALYPGGGAVEPPGAPKGLTGSANGNVISLNWMAPANAVERSATTAAGERAGQLTSYVIRAGSVAFGNDLADFDTGSLQTSFTANGVPNGDFNIHVRSKGPGGLSNPSENILVSVGGAGPPPCNAPPPAPFNLQFFVNGRFVRLLWSASINTTSYALVVGSVSGAGDIGTFDTGDPGTQFVVPSAPPGNYFVRVFAKNACGNSGFSNEVGFGVV